MARLDQDRLSCIFFALSHPTRRRILARLETEPRLSIGDLARQFSLNLATLLKHLDVLSSIGLVRRSKVGRTVWVEIEIGSTKVAIDWLECHRAPLPVRHPGCPGEAPMSAPSRL